MQRFFPEAPLEITGVELDPAVTAITAAHFPPPTKPYTIIHADSRVFLRGTDARYDVIVADAYTSQLTIPPHLVSREFFELVRSRLTPDGVLVANINAPSRDSVLLRTIEQTVAIAFPHVVIGKAGEAWNYLILASDTPIGDRLTALSAPQLPPSATKEIQRFLETAEVVVPDVSPSTTFWSGKSGVGFTDDWAPLELFTDLEIFEAIRRVGKSKR
jgi:spermidine synthase